MNGSKKKGRRRTRNKSPAVKAGVTKALPQHKPGAGAIPTPLALPRQGLTTPVIDETSSAAVMIDVKSEVDPHVEGISTMYPDQPDSCSQQVLLDTWLRFRTPVGSIAGRNKAIVDESTGEIYHLKGRVRCTTEKPHTKRATARKGLDYKIKGLPIFKSLESDANSMGLFIKEPYRMRVESTHSVRSRIATTGSARSSVVEIRNKDAEEYIMENFMITASVFADLVEQASDMSEYKHNMTDREAKLNEYRLVRDAKRVEEQDIPDPDLKGVANDDVPFPVEEVQEEAGKTQGNVVKFPSKNKPQKARAKHSKTASPPATGVHAQRTSNFMKFLEHARRIEEVRSAANAWNFCGPPQQELVSEETLHNTPPNKAASVGVDVNHLPVNFARAWLNGHGQSPGFDLGRGRAEVSFALEKVYEKAGVTLSDHNRSSRELGKLEASREQRRLKALKKRFEFEGALRRRLRDEGKDELLTEGGIIIPGPP